MSVLTSEVGYTSAMSRREDHEVHKDMWGIGRRRRTFIYNRYEGFVILHFNILCVAILRLHDEILWVTTIQIFLELFYPPFILFQIYTHSVYSNLAYDKLNWHLLLFSRLTEGRRHWK